MFTIVGLGNPGADYATTRHNVGWIVLTNVLEAHDQGGMMEKSKCSGMVKEAVLFSHEVVVLFPTTYMNKSGIAVQKCLKGVENGVEGLIVVHDDIDLPFGSIRVSLGSGAGGHNGVRSIIDTLGTKNFVRIRVGIAHRGLFGIVKRPRGEALSEYVLKVFSSSELQTLDEVSRKVEVALESIMNDGVERAMQRVNGV